MNTKQLATQKEEQQLLSKEAIKLPPKQRLELLLKAEKYPIVRKRTSAERQIKEMIDFYNFCCLMLAQYFPNERAENNFIALNFMTAQEGTKAICTEELTKAFNMLGRYEELEKRVEAIRSLFQQYQYAFPDLYEAYNLEDIVTERISDVIYENKQLMKEDPQLAEEILGRWKLLS